MLARAALEDSIAYAKTRKTFGKPIGEHQSIQIKLAEMATKLEASRLLTEQAAIAYDSGIRSDLQAGMAKFLLQKQHCLILQKLCGFMVDLGTLQNII